MNRYFVIFSEKKHLGLQIQNPFSVSPASVLSIAFDSESSTNLYVYFGGIFNIPVQSSGTTPTLHNVALACLPMVDSQIQPIGIVRNPYQFFNFSISSQFPLVCGKPNDGLGDMRSIGGVDGPVKSIVVDHPKRASSEVIFGGAFSSTKGRKGEFRTTCGCGILRYDLKSNYWFPVPQTTNDCAGLVLTLLPHDVENSFYSTDWFFLAMIVIVLAFLVFILIIVLTMRRRYVVIPDYGYRNLDAVLDFPQSMKDNRSLEGEGVPLLQVAKRVFEDDEKQVNGNVINFSDFFFASFTPPFFSRASIFCHQILRNYTLIPLLFEELPNQAIYELIQNEVLFRKSRFWVVLAQFKRHST